MSRWVCLSGVVQFGSGKAKWNILYKKRQSIWGCNMLSWKTKNGQLLWLSGIHVHVSTKPVCSGCSDESGCIRRSVKEGYGVAVELRQYFQTLA